MEAFNFFSISLHARTGRSVFAHLRSASFQPVEIARTGKLATRQSAAVIAMEVGSVLIPLPDPPIAMTGSVVRRPCWKESVLPNLSEVVPLVTRDLIEIRK